MRKRERERKRELEELSLFVRKVFIPPNALMV
jgi:hypothetical protein